MVRMEISSGSGDGQNLKSRFPASISSRLRVAISLILGLGICANSSLISRIPLLRVSGVA